MPQAKGKGGIRQDVARLELDTPLKPVGRIKLKPRHWKCLPARRVRPELDESVCLVAFLRRENALQPHKPGESIARPWPERQAALHAHVVRPLRRDETDPAAAIKRLERRILLSFGEPPRRQADNARTRLKPLPPCVDIVGRTDICRIPGQRLFYLSGGPAVVPEQVAARVAEQAQFRPGVEDAYMAGLRVAQTIKKGISPVDGVKERPDGVPARISPERPIAPDDLHQAYEIIVLEANELQPAPVPFA